MNSIKRYELARRMYVPVKVGGRRSYGGRQQWFSKDIKKTKDLKAYFTHMNGCGVIALSDLFLYFAMTIPEGKDTHAAQFMDKYKNVTQEEYMKFVDIIQDKYAKIYGSCGTFGWELSRAVNSYCKDNSLPYEAAFEVGLSNLEMLHKMQDMLTHNYPVILMIGQSWPVSLSKLRKVGIPFFKRTWAKRSTSELATRSYVAYEIAERNVYGHFVVVTGVIIDEKANWASQKIMLKISSWGEEYYISYDHYCQFLKRISKPWLCGLISLSKQEQVENEPAK